MLYTVLNLESSAFLFHLLPNIPLQHLFHSSIFTHQPFSPTSFVIPQGNTNNHLSSFLPPLQLSFHSWPLHHSIFFLHTSLPLTICSSITFTHMDNHMLLLVLAPFLCPSSILFHPSLLLPCCYSLRHSLNAKHKSSVFISLLADLKLDTESVGKTKTSG